MPGPKKFKAVKTAVVIGRNIADEIISSGLSLLEAMYIKYEIVSALKTTDNEIADYAANAKKRGIETVIVVSDVADSLPVLVAKNSFAPVIFAPYSNTKKSIPGKILSQAPFAAAALNNFTSAVLIALKIISIRDKSLSRRMAKLRSPF